MDNYQLQNSPKLGFYHPQRATILKKLISIFKMPKNVSDSYPVVPNLHVKSADGYPVTIR